MSGAALLLAVSLIADNPYWLLWSALLFVVVLLLAVPELSRLSSKQVVTTSVGLAGLAVAGCIAFTFAIALLLYIAASAGGGD